MNEKLKFSWGHIIAFLSLIFISYVTFMGVTYLTEGSYVVAACVMVVADAILIATFIGAQYLKGTERRFGRFIKVERVLVFASPVVFIVCAIPFFHFWTVLAQGDDIVYTFRQSVKGSAGIFFKYDEYANGRIAAYDRAMTAVMQGKRQPLYAQCGFTGVHDDIHKANCVKALRLQLMSQNYETLKASATKWIQKSENGASVWNIFLMGNVRQIKEAIKGWEASLVKSASVRLSSEKALGTTDYKLFAGESDTALDGLDGLNDMYTQMAFPNIPAILSAIVCYLMLLFPYFLQERNTKSIYRLVGYKSGFGPQDERETVDLDFSDAKDTQEAETMQMDAPEDRPKPRRGKKRNDKQNGDEGITFRL